MSNPNINIEILAETNDELVNGHPVISGKIVLKPRETITIDSMNVYLSYEVKGKMSPIKNLMGVQNLFSYSKQLSRDQHYEFPFSFVVSDGIYSFTGKNAALHHKLEVGMDINPEDYNKVKPGVFSSLRKMVTNDTSIRSHRYIYFENVTKNYQVETSEVTLQRKFIYWLAFVLSVVFAAIGLFFIIPEMSQVYVIVTIVSSLLLGFSFTNRY